jgi:hypothetical protein
MTADREAPGLLNVKDVLRELDELAAARAGRLPCGKGGCGLKIGFNEMRAAGYPVSLDHGNQLRLLYPALHEALMLMKRFSPLGNWLVGEAARLDLFFAAAPQKNSFGSYGARTVTVNKDNGVPFNVSIAAHEIFHGVQAFWRAIYPPKNADYRSLIAHELCLEAAAQTCAVRVAFEAKLNGYLDAFDYFDTCAERPGEIKYAALYHEFGHRYARRRAEGMAQEEALQAACDHTWQAYIDSQGLRDSYNNIVLERFMRMISLGVCNFHPEPLAGPDDALGKCRMGENTYLTRNVRIPATDRELFGANTPMRQAFAFAEYRQLEQYARGRPGAGFLPAKRAALEADGNPYWARRDKIDFSEVLASFEAERRRSDAPVAFLSVLNDTAGIGNETQLPLNFFHVAGMARASQPPRGILCLPAPGAS